MTEPSGERKAQTAWQMLKPDFDWLGHLVSWKAIILALCVLAVAVAVFVVAGGVNVSADVPDSWFARHFLHFVFKRSEESRSTAVIPPNDVHDPSRVRIGAQHFDMVCSNCHGRPGFGQSVIALSMSPRPQYLPKVVDQFTDSELYLIVAHGVKYSAMPSWPTDQGGDDEVWSMVAFLRQLPRLDGKAYREMTALPEKAGPMPAGANGTANAGPASGGAAPTGPGSDAALRPADVQRNSPPTDEFLYAAPASGFSDQTIHQDPTATCARCHGADGTGTVTGGEAPNLTIQDAGYLQKSLEAYTSGARKSGFMQNIAAQLSGAQVAELANYYAGLPVHTVASPQADPALVKRGETIATQGIRERAIPACAYCHESGGSKLTGAPHIAGQSAKYLRHELDALRVGGRGSSVVWNPMSAVAHDLGDNDIAALAAYYSGLKPAKAGGEQAAQWPHAMIPKGDIASAKAIFDTRCVKCHANDGRGDPAGAFPDLTIQSTPYVAQSLFSFRTRARSNEKMLEVIDSLSFDDMTNLANYVDSLKPQPALAKPDAAAASRGAAIAMHGASDRGVPACLGCHGAKGTTALPLIPRLQGQSPVYLRARLDSFASPSDANVAAINPMPAIARKLTDEERSDLAAYFAAAAPLDKTGAQP